MIQFYSEEELSHIEIDDSQRIISREVPNQIRKFIKLFVNKNFPIKFRLENKSC